MRKASEIAKESFKNHPKPWLIAGTIGTMVVFGAGIDLKAGHFDKFLPGASSDADGRTPVADTKEIGTRKGQQLSNADALGSIGCITHIQNNGGPEISVTFTNGSMPNDASLAAVVHFAGGDNHSYHYGGDRGSTHMDVPTGRHGNVVDSAQASITAHGNVIACAATPEVPGA